MSKVVSVAKLDRRWTVTNSPDHKVKLSEQWTFLSATFLREIVGTITKLLNCLPDTDSWDEWGYCWNTLSDNTQDAVIAAREDAEGVLYTLREENDG